MNDQRYERLMQAASQLAAIHAEIEDILGEEEQDRSDPTGGGLRRIRVDALESVICSIGNARDFLQSGRMDHRLSPYDLGARVFNENLIGRPPRILSNPWEDGGQILDEAKCQEFSEGYSDAEVDHGERAFGE